MSKNHNLYSNSEFLNDLSFSEFAGFLKAESGIDLGNNKQYLVATRLKKLLADHEIYSIKELLDKKHVLHNRVIKESIIDAMTTNETFWFRDNYPYDYLKNSLIEKISVQKKTINIWSCACSSGQEPYSISMIFDEYNKLKREKIDLKVTATDLSNDILSEAKAGCYDKLSIARGLSSDRLNTYFIKNDQNKWVVKDNIKNYVQFKKANLKDDYFASVKYDVVFCRNVLIYFSRDLKNKIIKNIHKNMCVGGYLFLGASESLADCGDYFDLIHINPGIVYRAK